MEEVISHVFRKGRALLRRVTMAPAPVPFAEDTALGATLKPDGVQFSVHAPDAEAVHLCLFKSSDHTRETSRLPMVRDENGVWHFFVPGLPPGAFYGFRAEGAWDPAKGQWFNPNKLLLDPYAKAVHGTAAWSALMQGATTEGGAHQQDSGPAMPKSVVIRDAFDWGSDSPPRTAWEDSVIYEMHVRGFTKKHPGVPPELQGTYAGLAHPSAIAELRHLGVTAVQLLPVHQHLDDGFLLQKGLTNYWGYNTLGFFAPQNTLAAARTAQAQVEEFKMMVRELHRAGIEVILDVVYNHTAEGDERGPMLCFRGLDNGGYYLLNPELRVMNYTGTGNTVNVASPIALRLVMDSLRYWVEQMHVDGFRFDLAATMGRRGEVFDGAAPFFQAVAQDPVLRNVKMIAEPWDIGPNGYQIGGFPKPWRELNGRYRDKVRRFWAGDPTVTAAFSKRLCGSQDIYGPAGKSPLVSLNMLTSHDGFTLRDLWGHNQKHNEANGEDNRDGDDNNHSWNAGVEGETNDESINAMRRRLARSCLATMFCSLGVPFLTMGDERWRTQRGNNNAYCQDNEISWVDWSATEDSAALLDFTSKLVRFRATHRELRRTAHFTGKLSSATGRPDLAWLDEKGAPMTHEKWHSEKSRFFAAVLDAKPPLLLLFNASLEDIECKLPAGKWRCVFDTAAEPSFPIEPTIVSGSQTSAGRSVICFEQIRA
ncbi:glycogen debranching enzyme [Verrucomicrobiaceae bacterium SCGC AG-212-N21]|nr:glycogen debranching enzyme [Verrucomicrobiaceae bacterium SCGC AG-212-N21]